MMNHESQEASLELMQTHEMPFDLESTLLDWFEGIEELELTEQQKQQLKDTAVILTDLFEAVKAQGMSESDFEDWLQLEVLEQWAMLMDLDDEIDMTCHNPVQLFASFVEQGQQRLYFQLVKHHSQSA